MAKQREPVAQLIFPNRENVTTGQIQNVLTVCNMAVTGLINPWRGFHSEEDAPQNPEARIALENTLTAACARLDQILKDDRRWSIEYQMALEAEFHKTHAENQKFMEAQRKASEEVASPHFQWRPQLMQSQDGKVWIALLGDPKDPMKGIMGMGRTPEEALEEFDKDFRGKEKSPEVIAFLKKRVVEQKHYEQNAVDTERDSNAGPRIGKENPNQGHREAIEPPASIGARLHSTFGPADPRHSLRTSETTKETISSGVVGTQGGGRETRTPLVRKVAAFLSRLWRRLDPRRARR